MASVQDSPKFSVQRKDVIAVDAANPTDAAAGGNFAGYDTALFNVIPSGGANPNIELLVWSKEAGSFISANSPFVRAGIGVDIPYHFTANAAGRKLFVKVTLLAAGSVTITAAGMRTGSF